MSIVEQILDLINLLIYKTKSDELDWVKTKNTTNTYECEINEALSIIIRRFDDGDIQIKIGDTWFYTCEIPIIKDPLLILISEVYTREHYKKVFEDRLLELANITLEIEKYKVEKRI